MRTLAIALLLSGAMVWAQSTTPQTPPAGAQGQTRAGAAQSPHRGMHRGQAGQGMGAAHMQDMNAMLTQMRSKLDSLRSSVSKVSDANTKAALQADYDLWETVYGHMKQMQSSMQQHMQGMQGMSGSESKPSSGQEPPPQR